MHIGLGLFGADSIGIEKFRNVQPDRKYVLVFELELCTYIYITRDFLLSSKRCLPLVLK